MINNLLISRIKRRWGDYYVCAEGISQVKCLHFHLAQPANLRNSQSVFLTILNYKFFCAVESISLIRFNWFTSLAPGS